jgi:hypothetical protein
MRRLLPIVLLVGLLAVPAADATVERTVGSVYLQFTDGAGLAKVRYRGNFFGSVRRGRIVATRNVIVSGYASKRTLASGLIEYRGPNSNSLRMGFRTPQPPTTWRLRLNGRGIYASGFVRGCMTLDGVDVGDPGRFRIGETTMLRPWPRTARTFRLGLGC